MRPQLDRSTISNARIQAFSHPLVAPPPDGFKGGVVFDNMNEHKRLRQSRYWQPVDRFRDDVEYTGHLEGEWAYAGPVYPHFGHFMSEMAHRALPTIMQDRAARMLFVGIRNDVVLNTYDKLPPFMKDFLHFFRIKPDDVRIVNEHSLVESLHVAEAGSDFGGGPKSGYLEDLRDFSIERLQNLKSTAPIFDKVYVSRNMLPIGGSFLGERYLEEVLVEEGFSIFHPERHSLIDQMKVYHRAKTLIFSEGSACHGTELLGEGMLNKCIFLARRKDHIEIFGKVLKPRSQDFILADLSFSLGSIVGGPGNPPAGHAGVSLLDFRRLSNLFREREISPLLNFSMQTYLEAAEEDLSRYCYQTLKRKLITSIDDMAKLYDKFVAARKQIQYDAEMHRVEAVVPEGLRHEPRFS